MVKEALLRSDCEEFNFVLPSSWLLVLLEEKHAFCFCLRGKFLMVLVSRGFFFTKNISNGPQDITFNNKIITILKQGETNNLKLTIVVFLLTMI